MRIALCFSGYIRDLEETKNFWTELIKKYNIDVYASFWDTENVELGDTLENFVNIYNAKKIEVESFSIYKQSTQDIASMNVLENDALPPVLKESSKAFWVLPMYYKVWKCNLLSKTTNIKYDLVIRARTDIVLDERFEIVNNNMLNVPMGFNSYTKFPHSNGINDCFAYANPKIMDYYSFIYLQLMEYLKDGHYIFPPEHLLSVHFTKVRVQIRSFPNYMMITRTSKGTTHEIYNHFVKKPSETVLWSDAYHFTPDPIGNFKKDIKNDFLIQ
jgi:hypothetical protein